MRMAFDQSRAKAVGCMLMFGAANVPTSTWLGVLLLINYSISFELDQPIRIDKARDLHDCICGANLAKKLAVNCGDALPILDADKKSTSANHLSQRCSGLLQSRSNYLKTSARLHGGISRANSASIRAKWRGAGDGDNIANAHSPRNADLRLVRAAAGDELTHDYA
jgi:hypothetical protein